MLVPVSAHGSATELRLGVHDLLDHAKQVEGAAREPVDARDGHYVAGGEGVEHFQKLAPVAVLTENRDPGGGSCAPLGQV